MKLVAKYPRDYVQMVGLAISRSHAPLCAVQHFDEIYIYLKPGHSNAELANAWVDFKRHLYLTTDGECGAP